MSASDPMSAIYLTDTPAIIEHKITKYAFSGGGDTLKLHREKGANLDVDVSYQYLSFFLDDDQNLADIALNYRSGRMLTSEVKRILIDVMTKRVLAHQEARARVTDDVVDRFMRQKSQ